MPLGLVLHYHAVARSQTKMMADKYDVFGLGNALVDILALVEDDFITQQELGKGSMQLVDAPQQGALLNKLEGLELKLRSGGSAANTMIAIAQSGGTAFYTGKIAGDTHGEFYRQDMIDAGVDFDVNPAEDGPTGTSLILTTPDAERTMCTNLGVSVTLAKDDVELEQLSKCKIAYIEGYLWSGDSTREVCKHVMQAAKEQGVQVAFTYSDMFLVDLFVEDFKQITKDLCDVVFCNADEIRHFFDKKSIDECTAALGEIVETAFVTDGAAGCHLVHKGKVTLIEGFPAKAVDTVGAGDAFAGGVLYGLTNGLSYEDAARWGNYVASRVVEVYGARLEESLVDQVDKILGR